MSTNENLFGVFLRKKIQQKKMTQAAFYSAVGITKPYFYDILSGKVNPPPPEIQYKMLENLKLDEEQRNEFLDLAAKGRNEIPADIADLILSNCDKLDIIRTELPRLLSKKR